MGVFINPQHPKASIACENRAIEKILKLGWWAQKKIDGSRAQIHISHEGKIVAYTRKGTIHTVELPEAIISFLLENYQPKKGWNVLDSEWLRFKDQLFLFDILRLEGELLSNLTFSERYNLLFGSPVITPHVQILPVYKTLKKCMDVLNTTQDLEGLVFKSPTTRGWPDTAIVRCRKDGIR